MWYRFFPFLPRASFFFFCFTARLLLFVSATCIPFSWFLLEVLVASFVCGESRGSSSRIGEAGKKKKTTSILINHKEAPSKQQFEILPPFFTLIPPFAQDLKGDKIDDEICSGNSKKKKKRDKLYTFFSTIRTAERDAVKKGRKFFFFFEPLFFWIV